MDFEHQERIKKNKSLKIHFPEEKKLPENEN